MSLESEVWATLTNGPDFNRSIEEAEANVLVSLG